jgi:hypothetical protein
MGLTNSPATFQHFMNDIFQDMADIFVIIYLDDILIFSKNIEDHHQHVRQVLDRLRKKLLWVKPKKSIFHTDWVEFLGFIVSKDVAMDEAKSSAIFAWPIPTNINEVQSFLGFAHFYCLILNFLDIVIHLTCLIWKETPFIWRDKE